MYNQSVCTGISGSSKSGDYDLLNPQHLRSPETIRLVVRVCQGMSLHSLMVRNTLLAVGTW